MRAQKLRDGDDRGPNDRGHVRGHVRGGGDANFQPFLESYI